MKTYMTDRTKFYTPYHQDMDDLARRRAQEPWIVTKVLTSILVVGMILAAFAVSPFMGVPMVLVMLAAVKRG